MCILGGVYTLGGTRTCPRLCVVAEVLDLSVVSILNLADLQALHLVTVLGCPCFARCERFSPELAVNILVVLPWLFVVVVWCLPCLVRGLEGVSAKVCVQDCNSFVASATGGIVWCAAVARAHSKTRCVCLCRWQLYDRVARDALRGFSLADPLLVAQQYIMAPRRSFL